MKDFWKELVHKLTVFFLRLLDEHPGKLIGSVLGFILGIFVVVLGFWRSLVLMAFVLIGFFLGKRKDDHKQLFDWINRFWD